MTIQPELKEIYKCVFDFFKLFRSTFSASVAKWRVNDLNSAFKWSSHIEDLIKRIELNRPKTAVIFIEHSHILFKHWHLDALLEAQVKCAQLMRTATSHLKNVETFNVHREIYLLLPS